MYCNNAWDGSELGGNASRHGSSITVGTTTAAIVAGMTLYAGTAEFGMNGLVPPAGDDVKDVLASSEDDGAGNES